MARPPITRGAHHIGLTGPDLAGARAFFVDTPGFDQVGETSDDPSAFMSDGVTMITLWQAADPENAVPFDRKNNVGLHHLALKVESADALDGLHQELDTTNGVDIELAPEPLAGGPTKHMMGVIPGGIRMEFTAPGG